MDGLSQIVLTGIRILFLLNVAGGEYDGWIDRIKSFSPNSFNHLASLSLLMPLFMLMPSMTLLPFRNIILSKSIKSSSKISLGFVDCFPYC